jgi:hypothetical protein
LSNQQETHGASLGNLCKTKYAVKRGTNIHCPRHKAQVVMSILSNAPAKMRFHTNAAIVLKARFGKMHLNGIQDVINIAFSGNAMARYVDVNIRAPYLRVACEHICVQPGILSNYLRNRGSHAHQNANSAAMKTGDATAE